MYVSEQLQSTYSFTDHLLYVKQTTVLLVQQKHTSIPNEKTIQVKLKLKVGQDSHNSMSSNSVCKNCLHKWHLSYTGIHTSYQMHS